MGTSGGVLAGAGLYDALRIPPRRGCVADSGAEAIGPRDGP